MTSHIRTSPRSLNSRTIGLAPLEDIKVAFPSVVAPFSATDSKGESLPDTISPPLAMVVGLDFGCNQYMAVKEANTMYPSVQTNIIGVVKSASEPSLTSCGDWTCSIKILDPSLFSSEDSSPSGLNAFVLRRNTSAGFPSFFMTSRLGGTTAIPETEEIIHNRGDVPLSACLARNGIGVRFPLFHNTQPQETDYCSKLFTWWGAILEKGRERFELGSIHQIDEGTRGLDISVTRRVHRLIGDLYELYVTDYTKNDQVIPMHSELWSSSLAESVLKIKMWDHVRPMGKTIERGRTYRIKNISELDEDDASSDVHPQEFLERKKRWKTIESHNRKPARFDAMFLSRY
ncbi:uncharacterized protein BT62DRAFT_1074219 [Guyanagaster necrorhizus]|uniref:Uncharacterized protein n=1 Tax=Guyanagaster necrorhizus TaxID=856835 RepID=A0A9P7VWN0_9AGAR|nr:uncharacterized protein BT62DRAFT_1074219 [Guyanagaster necrorhizus MCA 3950]KAG7448663.1 hypothetical protein BT62DRAFT_1074219 [Guyanagaster necrorhizus MCA 3950]